MQKQFKENGDIFSLLIPKKFCCDEVGSLYRWKVSCVFFGQISCCSFVATWSINIHVLLPTLAYSVLIEPAW